MGRSWPKSFDRALIVAEHGSWDRSTKIGYRLKLLRLQRDGATAKEQAGPAAARAAGAPRVAAHEELLTGFVGGKRGDPKDKQVSWARPVDVAQLPDGGCPGPERPRTRHGLARRRPASFSGGGGRGCGLGPWPAAARGGSAAADATPNRRTRAPPLGSLLISDDAGHTVFRMHYTGRPRAPPPPLPASNGAGAGAGRGLLSGASRAERLLLGAGVLLQAALPRRLRRPRHRSE